LPVKKLVGYYFRVSIRSRLEPGAHYNGEHRFKFQIKPDAFAWVHAGNRQLATGY